MSEIAKQSFGEQAVNLSFNPSASPSVQELKQKAADFIDACHHLQQSTENADTHRMLAVAIMQAETAQMWAVKGATFNPETQI